MGEPMTPQAIVGLALKASIMLTLFCFGLEATREDTLYLLRRPRVLMLSLAAMFLVMPVIAILLTSLAPFDRAVVIALVALSISPVPPLLPRKVTKAGGVAPYGLGLMVTAACFSIAYIPLAAYLIGRYFNRPFAMGSGAVANLVAVSVLAPLAAGMVFRHFAPTAAGRMAKPLLRIAEIVLLCGVLSILVFALPSVLSLIGNGTILVIAAFVAVGVTVGHFFGGPGPDERVTLALSTAYRHPALAIAIARANFPGERRVFSAILLYALLNTLLTIPYVAWQRKKVRKGVTPATD